MSETEKAIRETEGAIADMQQVLEFAKLDLVQDIDEGEEESFLAECERRIQALLHLIAEARKVPGLLQSLKRETDGHYEVRQQLNIVKTNTEGVWRWQGDGDDPESLSCPVVMSADTLRSFVAEVRRCERVREWAEAERDETGWSDDLHDGYTLAQEHARLRLSAPDAETMEVTRG